MEEVFQGWVVVFTSISNFLFEMKFTERMSVGSFLLATSSISLIIRYIFSPTWASTPISASPEKSESMVLNSIENVMRSQK